MKQKEKDALLIRPIAYMHSDFPEKFGIPRQSGLVASLQSRIVFEEEYRAEEAFRGLEEYSHLWLLWGFSENVGKGWSPTVRPPKLGGNIRKGVFATRSPFRPNPIGLSSVKIEKIEKTSSEGVVLYVSGADLMDGTPIYDMKPYLPYVDCHTDAEESFAHAHKEDALEVHIPKQWKNVVPQDKLEALIGVLKQDPRPAYQKDPSRVYGLSFAGMEIRFKVNARLLEVCMVQTAGERKKDVEQELT